MNDNSHDMTRRQGLALIGAAAGALMLSAFDASGSILSDSVAARGAAGRPRQRSRRACA